jgi:hypothetical protein
MHVAQVPNFTDVTEHVIPIACSLSCTVATQRVHEICRVETDDVVKGVACSNTPLMTYIKFEYLSRFNPFLLDSKLQSYIVLKIFHIYYYSFRLFYNCPLGRTISRSMKCLWRLMR